MTWFSLVFSQGPVEYQLAQVFWRLVDWDLSTWEIVEVKPPTNRRKPQEHLSSLQSRAFTQILAIPKWGRKLFHC